MCVMLLMVNGKLSLSGEEKIKEEFSTLIYVSLMLDFPLSLMVEVSRATHSTPSGKTAVMSHVSCSGRAEVTSVRE